MRIRALGQSFQYSILVLAAVEALVFAASLYVAVLLRFTDLSLAEFEAVRGSLFPRSVLFSAVMLTSFMALGLYSARQRADIVGLGLRIMLGLAAGFVVLVICFYAIPLQQLGRGVLGLAVGVALVFVLAARSVFARLVDHQSLKRRVLVYGCSSRVKPFAKLRRRSDRRGYRIVGFVAPPGETPELEGETVLDAAEGLPALCARLNVVEIVVALKDRRQRLPSDELMQCRLAGIGVVDLVSFLERENGLVLIEGLNPSWIIFGEGYRHNLWRRVTSRLLDLSASLLLLVLAGPIMLVTALLIWLDDGRKGGVFYRQERVGLGGRGFELLKFRSMRVDAEAAGAPQWAQKNDPRVTRIGAFLRKSRIDELPQLLNVLRGEMSFVGPRPERPHFVQQLEAKILFYAQRHSVKPGITGWAQLCFPYGASEDDALQKLQYDLYYVKNNTLLFDLAILVQTAEVVFMGKGR